MKICKRAEILTAFIGMVAGGALVKHVWLEKYRQQKKELTASNQERDLLYTWLLLEQRGVGPWEYFTAHGFKTIGIMGMNRVGRRFFDALQGHEEVTAVYALELDHFNAVHEHMIVYRLGEDSLPPADCIVICDLAGIPEKVEMIQKDFNGGIVTLYKVLAWLLEYHQIKPWDGALKGWPL